MAWRVRELLNFGLSGRGGGGLSAPASRAALQDVSVMQKAIEHGADSANVAEQICDYLLLLVVTQNIAHVDAG